MALKMEAITGGPVFMEAITGPVVIKGHSPYIDETALHWFEWSDADQKYVDTGRVAALQDYIDQATAAAETAKDDAEAAKTSAAASAESAAASASGSGASATAAASSASAAADSATAANESAAQAAEILIDKANGRGITLTVENGNLVVSYEEAE